MDKLDEELGLTEEQEAEVKRVGELIDKRICSRCYNPLVQESEYVWYCPCWGGVRLAIG